MERTGYNLFLLLFLVLFFVAGIMIILKTPYGDFPDEDGHLKYIQYFSSGHKLLPDINDRDHIPTPQAFQPPLYYVLVSPFLSFPLAFSQTLILLRLLSLCMAAATVVVVRQAALLITPSDSPVWLLAVSLIAWNPQFLFVHCGISNTPFSSLFSSLSILMMLYALQIPAREQRYFLVAGVMAGAAILSRTSCIFLIPMALGAACFSGARIRNASIVLVTTLFVCGWWLLRNWMHFGDPFLWKFTELTVGAPYVHTEPRNFAFWLNSIARLHASFWAYFGPERYHAAIWEYAVYLFLEIVAGFGLIEWLRRVGFQQGRLLLLMLAGAALIVAEVFFVHYRIQTVGRYFYVAIAPISILMAAGIVEAMPVRVRRAGALILAFGLCFYCFYLLASYWYPHYT